MSFIIVWRSNHREPFINTDYNGFKEDYTTYEDAKEAAELILMAERSDNSSLYHDFEIFELAQP